MLGFASVSEAPLSQASSKVVALGYLATINGLTVAGTLSYEALASIISPSTLVTGVVNSFGDVDAQATTGVVSALASFNINDLAEVYGEANITPSAATASFVAEDFAEVTGLAHITFPAAIGSVTNSSVDLDAKANITSSSVSSTFAIQDLADVHAQARSFITTVLAQGYTNLTEPISVKFPYQDYADQYSRTRTVYLISYDTNTTSHVVAQDNTVYTSKDSVNNIVYVSPVSYSVVIDKLNGSNTVHITR